MMRRTILPLLLTASLLGACATKISDADVLEEQVTLTQVQRYSKEDRKSTLLIDARSAADYAAGHIPGAANIQVTQIPPTDPSGGSTATDPRLLKYDTLIVYGANPGTINSMALAKRLLEAGYKDVKYFADGYDAWKSSGAPIETGTPDNRSR